MRSHLPVALLGGLSLVLLAFNLGAQDPDADAPPAAATADTPDQTGDWVELFDGRTLDGWTAEGGRYDGAAEWTVEDGALTGREGEDSAGGLIYTERRYRDFVFECDVKMTWPFDSGIFLRMVPRAENDLKGPQVTLDYRPGGEVGGIYADGYLHHNPDGADRFLKDEWNRVRVACCGHDFHLQVWLNGTLLTDYRLPEGTAAAADGGFSRDGRIGLQVHGARGEPATSVVQFRNIRIMELSTHEPQLFRCDERGNLHLTEGGRRDGWQPLFNGVDLAGWTMVGGAGEQPLGAKVRDGRIVFTKDGPDGYLRTLDLFEDFELRLDFKIGFMCNSGLFLRGDPKSGYPSFSGLEIQILDDFNWERVTESRLAPYQLTGGLYGSLAPPETKNLRPLGRWNTYKVRYQGSQLAVWLNDHQLYDVDTHDVPVPAGQKPFAERAARGFIGLQRHAPAQTRGDYARFRNIFIKPL